MHEPSSGVRKTRSLPTLAVIGAGRAGNTLALSAYRAGYTIRAIYTRSPERGQAIRTETGAAILPDIRSLARSADLILIAVPDDTIAEIDSTGAGDWQAGSGVVHHSGLYGTDVLQHAAKAGAFTGTMHPLQALTDAETVIRSLPGTYFGVSGHPDLLPILYDLIVALDGRPLPIPDAAKALYHAAAVYASNYMVTCFAQAVDIFTDLGISSEQAVQALLPLTQGAITNLASPGLPSALTGPISRGDLGTIRAHQRHLAGQSQDALDLYNRLGHATVSIAAAQNKLSDQTLKAMSEIFSPMTSDDANAHSCSQSPDFVRSQP